MIRFRGARSLAVAAVVTAVTAALLATPSQATDKQANPDHAAVQAASAAQPKPAESSIITVPTAHGVSPTACGGEAYRASDGGWDLFWTNCWGTYTRLVAPLWSNGQGSYWTNVRNGSGASLCQDIQPGQRKKWHIVPSDTPPANYISVTFCVTF
jgi:hypothetical protein